MALIDFEGGMLTYLRKSGAAPSDVSDEAILDASPLPVYLDIDPGFGQMWHELDLHVRRPSRGDHQRQNPSRARLLARTATQRDSTPSKSAISPESTP